MDKQEIIRLFRDNIGISKLMSDDQYEVNTKEVNFDYDGTDIKIKNVSLVCFTEKQVWFNDDGGYDMDKMNGYFMFSTEPSETIHSMVKAFHKVKMLIESFGGEV